MTWLLRGAFLVLIVLTLGWKIAAPPVLEQSGDAAGKVTAVLKGRLSGPVTSQPWGGPKNDSLILSAPVVGCAAPLIVVTVHPSFTSAEALLQFQPPRGHHLFAYLDWVSDRPDRWMLLRRRIREKAKAMVGLSSYVSSDSMLFIAEPAGCTVARSVPWRRFWAPR